MSKNVVLTVRGSRAELTLHHINDWAAFDDLCSYLETRGLAIGGRLDGPDVRVAIATRAGVKLRITMEEPYGSDIEGTGDAACDEIVAIATDLQSGPG